MLPETLSFFFDFGFAAGALAFFFFEHFLDALLLFAVLTFALRFSGFFLGAEAGCLLVNLVLCICFGWSTDWY